MALFDSLQDHDLKRLAQDIVKDTANDVKEEVTVGKMLNIVRKGKTPAGIAIQAGQDLKVVEKLHDAAVKNVKEEFGMETETTSGSSIATVSSTCEAIQDNTIKHDDFRVAKIPRFVNGEHKKFRPDNE